MCVCVFVCFSVLHLWLKGVHVTQTENPVGVHEKGERQQGRGVTQVRVVVNLYNLRVCFNMRTNVQRMNWGKDGVKVISDFPCFPLSDSRLPIYYLQLFSVITQLTVHLVFSLSHCGNMACCSTTVSWFLNSPLGQTSSVGMLALYSRKVNIEGNNGEGEGGFLEIHRLGVEQSCISMKTKCEVVNYRKMKQGGQNGGAAWVSLVLWCVYTKGCKWIQDGVWSLPAATPSKSQTASEVTAL